jgi:hypothetical protein
MALTLAVLSFVCLVVAKQDAAEVAAKLNAAEAANG